MIGEYTIKSKATSLYRKLFKKEYKFHKTHVNHEDILIMEIINGKFKGFLLVKNKKNGIELFNKLKLKNYSFLPKAEPQ